MPRDGFRRIFPQPTINMKKLITIAAAAIMSMGALAFTASAHEPEESAEPRVDPRRTDETIYDPRGDDRRNYDRQKDWDAVPRLRRQVDHLNRMLDHVRAEMRAYGANRRIWGHYEHIRGEAWQLNNDFRRGVQYYDRRRLR